MADRLQLGSERILRILTYVLPVLGGTIGIFWINMTAHGSPILGIGAGAFAGWVVALVLSRILQRGSSERSIGK